jgi:hypothetical protein
MEARLSLRQLNVEKTTVLAAAMFLVIETLAPREFDGATSTADERDFAES